MSEREEMDVQKQNGQSFKYSIERQMHGHMDKRCKYFILESTAYVRGHAYGAGHVHTGQRMVQCLRILTVGHDLLNVMYTTSPLSNEGE